MLVLLLTLFVASVPFVSCRGDTAEERQEAVENGVLAIEHYIGTERENETYTIWERLDTLNTPGLVVATIRDFDVDWAEGYGFAQPDVPMTPDAVFQMASVSKFVTAMATLRLVQDGQLNVDTNVNDYLTTWQVTDNNFTETEKVTLRRIMSHTAGLTVPGFPGYPAGQDVPTLLQVLDGVHPANSGPVYVDYVPGSGERYSGGGTTVQQLVLAEYAETQGKTFESYMKDEVLDPVGMFDSSFEDRDRNDRSGVATGFVCQNNQPTEINGYWHTYPEKAAAGLYSTAYDITRYMMDIARAWNGDPLTVLTQDTARQMLTVQYPEGVELYGLGPSVYDFNFLEDIWFGHGGSNEGYCCQALASTGGDGVVIISNGDCGDSQAQDVIFELMRTINNVYGWIPAPILDILITPRLRVKLPLDSPQDYEGSYQVEGSVPEGSEFQDMYHITADTITSDVPEVCSFRLWPAADTDTEYLSDAWYYSFPRPRIEFFPGTSGAVDTMVITQGEITATYNRI